MANYDFFQNKKCEYFPCHDGANPDEFSCLFCYCPLYVLGEKCGGNYKYLESGVKDCSGCLRPHKRESYDGMQKQMADIIEMVRTQHNHEKP